MRQMEVADDSTLHCTHGDGEGRECGEEEVEVMKSKTRQSWLHDTPEGSHAPNQGPSESGDGYRYCMAMAGRVSPLRFETASIAKFKSKSALDSLPLLAAAVLPV